MSTETGRRLRGTGTHVVVALQREPVAAGVVGVVAAPATGGVCNACRAVGVKLAAACAVRCSAARQCGSWRSVGRSWAERPSEQGRAGGGALQRLCPPHTAELTLHARGRCEQQQRRQQREHGAHRPRRDTVPTALTHCSAASPDVARWAATLNAHTQRATQEASMLYVSGLHVRALRLTLIRNLQPITQSFFDSPGLYRNAELPEEHTGGWAGLAHMAMGQQ